MTPAPQSSTSLWVNATALPTFLAMVWLFNRGLLSFPDPALSVACSLGVALLPMILLDLALLKVHRRPSTGLDFSAPRRPLDLARLATKLIGLAGTLGVCALLYWILPEYHRPFYAPFFRLALASLELLFLCAAFYFAYLDGRMRVTEDGYWHAGSLLLGAWRSVDLGELRRHALAWLVKAFFLPVMFVGLLDNFSWHLGARYDQVFSSFRSFYDFSFELCFTIDLVHAVIGYLLTCRLIDAQIRSTEPTVFGWLVTLVCYVPFWGLLRGGFLEYEDGFTWGSWLSSPLPRALWGSAILLLHLVYAISSACFGCRFSNLTYRGVLTRGPYRWSKHPAYLSKNLAWWLISIPFISRESWTAALRNSLVLGFLNLIYFARARTEERHLSAYPEYVGYGLFMNEHGALRFLGRLLPWLRYRAPDA